MCQNVASLFDLFQMDERGLRPGTHSKMNLTYEDKSFENGVTDGEFRRYRHSDQADVEESGRGIGIH